MQKRQTQFTHPPRVSKLYRMIAGQDCEITILRDSWLCKVLRRPTLALWTRIYVRETILPKKLFELELAKLHKQHEQGWPRTLWDLLFSR